MTRPGDRVLIFLPGELPGSVGDLLRLGLQRQGRQPIPYGPVRDPLQALDMIDNTKADCLVGAPVQVLGLSGVPDAGDDFVVVEDERLAKEVEELVAV